MILQENSNDGARMDRVVVFEATHSKIGQDDIRHWIHPNYEQLHVSYLLLNYYTEVIITVVN